MSPNRIVALLTPLVFAPLAGVISTWAAENLPGVAISPQDVEKIFIAGALIALAPAAQWLYGWQKHEERQSRELELALTGANTPIAMSEAPPPPEDPVVEDDLAYLDDELDELDDFDEFEDTSVVDDEPVPAGS